MTPKLVQYFKGAQDALGFAGGPVRPPRLALDDAGPRVLDAARRRAAARRPSPDPMRAARSIAAVDSHTEGMPTRVVIGRRRARSRARRCSSASCTSRREHGRPAAPADARAARARGDVGRDPPAADARRRGLGRPLHRGLRAACRCAGTGRSASPPCWWRPAWSRCASRRRSCGSTRRPASSRRASRCEGGRARAVTLRNVPSFLHATDREVDVPGLGRVRYDMAFGGNFYAILPAASVGLEVDPARARRADRRPAWRSSRAIDAADRPSTRRTRGSRAAPTSSSTRRAATAPTRARRPRSIPAGWTARRAGPGTSARLAQLHGRGELAVGDAFVNESVIGTRFTGRVAAETTVAGRPGDRARDHRPRVDHRDGPVPARRRRPVPRRLRPVTDVVVVGAGIVGAAVARELAVRGVGVTLLDRGAVSSGTTGLGEGNVLCSDKDAGPELDAGPRGPGALRRARGAARRRGADPPQGRADRPSRRRTTWAGEPARLARAGRSPERRLLDAGRVRAARARADRPAARREPLPRPTCSATRGRSPARSPREAAAAGAELRDGLRGRARSRPATAACSARARRADRRARGRPRRRARGARRSPRPPGCRCRSSRARASSSGSPRRRPG